VLAAAGALEGGAAFHHARFGVVAVVGLVLAAAPLVEVVVHAAGQRAVLHVLGLAVGGAGHAARIAVAAGPAAALFGQFHLGAGFEHVGELHRVLGVHLRRAGGRRLLPAEAQVEVLAVMGGLYLGIDEGGLAGDGAGFQLLAAGHLLAHVAGFLGVTVGAGFALAQGTGAAVLGALGDPFHRRDAGVEQCDVGGRHRAPVGGRRGKYGLGAQQQAAGDGGV